MMGSKPLLWPLWELGQELDEEVPVLQPRISSPREGLA